MLNPDSNGPENLDNDRILARASAAIAETTTNIFSMMLGASVEIGPTVTEQPATALRRTVAGVIGWVGEWSGTGIVECTPECACLIANLMLGTEGEVLSEDALDTVAEVANVIFGGMKTELEAEVGPIGLGTPTVIYGAEMGMRRFGMAFTSIPIKLREHVFYVKLYMIKAKEKSPAKEDDLDRHTKSLLQTVEC